ncbi:hypothetical protein AgCh_039079 [Apium graveolens]
MGWKNGRDWGRGFSAESKEREGEERKREDVSNREGLASEKYCCIKCYDPSYMGQSDKPDFCLLAEFPPEGSSFLELAPMIGRGDESLHSQLSNHMFDESCFMNTPDSSYNSDLGSGNEDSHDTSFIIYGESSDEADFLSI